MSRHVVPVPSPPVRRSVRAAATGLVLLLGVAACGSTDDGPDGEAGPTTVAAEGFPVELSSPFGTSVLDDVPDRVLAPSPFDLDLALSLGVVPVAAPHSAIGEPELEPFQEAVRTELGLTDEVETFFDPYAELDFEAIAALAPDAILATGSWLLTPDDYDLLADIAPVVSYTEPEGNSTQPWADRLQIVAEALGATDQVDAVLDRVDSAFSDVAAAHPEFAGRSLTYAVLYPDDQLTFLSAADDASNEFFTRLGFAPSPNAGEFSAVYPGNVVSMEVLPLLEADVLVLGFHEGIAEGEQEAFLTSPLFTGLDVAQRGDVVVLPQGHSSNIAFPDPVILTSELEVIAPVLAAPGTA